MKWTTSHFTITLQELIEDGAEIFNFPYEVPEGVDKEYLEQRFIQTYLFREIGYETYSMWHYRFKHDWVVHLETYHHLFKINYDEIDPLIRGKTRITDKVEGSRTGDGVEIMTGEGTHESSDEQNVRDTPISEYDESEFVSEIVRGKNETSTGTTQETTKNDEEITNSLRDYLEEKIGNIDDVNNYIRKIRNITTDFIREFNNLFMGIYN